MEKPGGQDARSGMGRGKRGRFSPSRPSVAAKRRKKGAFHDADVPAGRKFTSETGAFADGLQKRADTAQSMVVSVFFEGENKGPARGRARERHYLPMQKESKMAFSVSSVLFRPVMSARWAEAASR